MYDNSATHCTPYIATGQHTNHGGQAVLRSLTAAEEEEEKALLDERFERGEDDFMKEDSTVVVGEFGEERDTEKESEARRRALSHKGLAFVLMLLCSTSSP